MAFVTDASIAAAWLLPDEEATLAETALDRLADETACVPDLFWHELRNLLLSAERRGRIDRHHGDASMARIRRLPIHSPRQSEDQYILALARRHGLAAYGSSYLALRDTGKLSTGHARPPTERCRRGRGVAGFRLSRFADLPPS